jgi:hypothetical protein
VKSLAGDVLSNSEVWHVYTITSGLIERMELGVSEANSQESPSLAQMEISFGRARELKLEVPISLDVQWKVCRNRARIGGRRL